jgi:hypothetical protein
MTTTGRKFENSSYHLSPLYSRNRKVGLSNIYKYINDKRIELNNHLLIENNYKPIKLTKSVADIFGKSKSGVSLPSPNKFRKIEFNPPRQRYHNSDILTNMDKNNVDFKSKYTKSENYDDYEKTLNTINAQGKRISYYNIYKSFKNYERAKYSSRPYGVVNSFGVSTYIGTIRDYNEDRVSIIMNVVKPVSRSNETWPMVSYFAIFDGHGGNGCANYMKANLHHYVRIQ